MKVIVVRHGETDLSDNINLHGRKQMQDLATDLKCEVDGKKCAILYSPLPRVTQSAEILITNLTPHCAKLYTAIHPELVLPETKDKRMVEKLIMTQMEDKEFILVVTSQEYTVYIPEWLTGDYFSPLEWGEAIIIDCETKEYYYI